MEGIIDLLIEAEKKGVSIFLEDKKLRIRVAKDSSIAPDFIENLKSKKEALIQFLNKDLINLSGIVTKQLSIGPQQRPDLLPLSFPQRRLWFIDKLEGGINYHIPLVLQMRGPLDEAALEKAYQELIQRHEVLRTVFKEKEGEPYQTIQSAEQWTLKKANATDSAALTAIIDAAIHTRFELSSEYPVRATLVKLSEEAHVLVSVLHHIVADGWSVPIFCYELAELYKASRYHQLPALSKLPIQYADFALWQINNQASYQPSLDYWVQRLRGLAPLQLPTDYPRPAMASRAGETLKFLLDKSLVKKIKTFSQQEGVTFFMTMLSAFKLLLHRYSGQEDICVGCGIANRRTRELEPLKIGRASCRERV